MPVTFDSYADTYKRTSDIIVNAQRALKKAKLSREIKSEGEEALKLLKESFQGYLNAIRGHEDFPVFVDDKEVLSNDFRILLFYKIADNLRRGAFTLPDKIRKTKIDFTQPGWPVLPDSPGFSAWLIFIQYVVPKLKMHNPELDVGEWAGDELLTPILQGDLAEYQGSDDEDQEYRGNNGLPTDEDEQGEESCDFQDWDLPDDLEPLVKSLKDMYEHGDEITAQELAKGLAAKRLAMALFKDLQTFHRLEPREQGAQKPTFITEFNVKLHSQDDVMSAHRAVWKNIVANILVAMAVVGLVAVAAPLAGVGMAVAGIPVVPLTAGVLFGALGLQCLLTRHGFFGNTQSEKNVATVAAEFSATELSR